MIRCATLCALLMLAGCFGVSGSIVRESQSVRLVNTGDTMASILVRGEVVEVPPGAELTVTDERHEVEQPSDAVMPATMTKTPTGESISTGTGDGYDPLEAQTVTLTWVGIGFVVLGLAATVLYFWKGSNPVLELVTRATRIKAIPWWLGPGLVAVGVAFIFLPNVIHRYSWVAVLIGVGLLAWGVIRAVLAYRKQAEDQRARAEQTEAGVDEFLAAADDTVSAEGLKTALQKKQAPALQLFHKRRKGKA